MVCRRTVSRPAASAASAAARRARWISRPVASPPACRIRGTEWAPSRPSSQGGVRSGRAVEGHTARHELVDGGRRVAHEHAHGVVVARPRPRGEGVLDVQLLGVAGLAGRERGRHGRDPALRAGRAGLVEGVLAQQRHVETVARGAQGRGEAGDAAAHHEHARCRVRAHRGSAASIRSSATSASRAVAASTEIRLITRPATSSSSIHAR